jgi:hypothetical protein
MKRAVVIPIVVLALLQLLQAQVITRPVAPPPRPQQLPQPTPGNPIAQPPIANPPINGDAGTYYPSETNPHAMDTNEFAETNHPPGEEPTNNMPETNAVSPEAAAAFGLTNRLSAMAPAQMQIVIHVHANLALLQSFAVNIGGHGVQEFVFRDQHAQLQLRQCSTEIINLARGPVRPSVDAVDRLSLDFLRACAHGRLHRQHLLVLAVVFNTACNCQNMTAQQLQEVFNGGLVVLREAGVPPAACSSIGCDLSVIASEIQPNLQL